ncbi:MAG: hypothetical protein K8J31_02310 [Anaerolineae bacterium]|nr:hypothetical protein [Anaerolineae bacterium]
MRSDLIAAGMIRSWLDTHAPEVAQDWAFQPDEELNGFVKRIKSVMAEIDAQFVSQAAIARTAIEHWRLRDVAILGGGTPSPLSPRPDQALYFTDANPAVIDEVSKLGYSVRRVDIQNLSDLRLLTGARTAIATGLFHFLDDEAAWGTFENLYQAGFEQVIFNNMNKNVPDDLAANWAKMGHTPYRRDPQDIQVLLPDHWELMEAINAPRFLSYNRQLGDAFSKLADINTVYRIIRRQTA